MVEKGKELLHRLRELEKNWKAGEISESKYRMLKREYQRELDAIEAAERIKRMQGRSTHEKPLDHWIEKTREEEEAREKEELIKKYVKKPTPMKEPERPRNALKMVGVLLLALAFFIGSGFGLYLLNLGSDQTGTVLVNESAFPTFTINHTNTTNYVPKTTYDNTTIYYEPTTPTTPTTPSEPPTNTSG
ncbi:MAG TPA: hypothetical protein PLO64_00595 [Methanothermobacter sp.]|nr:conserved hypothetical protein [Methanothermobacter sp. MT-2]HHW04649.1 hypothetical protein [Methanothermobacter sp.]HOK72114.1 hypothetical protein [Methanothermobacter sp.]HOL68427.1 hypothetical protein [Methanothermobacter sp.]HPQ04185.1 hypothetical protein [Methanothermobacter sp.]